MKPVLLLDIDGVVNATSRELPRHVWPTLAWGQHTYTTPQGVTFELLWSRPAVEYLGSLHTSGRVEIRWHSTWQESSLEFARIVGLPEFEVASAPEFLANGPLFAKQQILAGKPTWWKFPAAERVLVEEGRPLIWIDDDLFWHVPRKQRSYLGDLGRVLLLCPDSQTGLIRKHMRSIEETLLAWEEAVGAVSGS